ncbi:DoxX family protein [uncultured Nocardioides sp.]|uniref:DoxX family protein n=1 Tax=uncultured Nocardioides sp. TaxID=198441 RepID=UPI00263404D7|nr:DoxX family protein [uncultured Nocardioides sp.]
MTAPHTSTTVPARRGRAATVVAWVAQVALAVVFVMAGAAKLFADPAMVEMFTTLGSEPLLRLVVGVLEVLGAVGLLVPRVAALAAGGLVLLMLGAAVANLAFLDSSPLLPLLLAVVAGLVVVLRRQDLTRS